MRLRMGMVYMGMALLLLLAARPAWSQGGNQGAVEGAVLDPSGAAIAGASLKATNTATGISFTAASDRSGLYEFPVLPVGTYTIVAVREGFATVTQNNVAVAIGARLTLDFSLPLAAQKATVTVTSRPPILETTKSAISSTVDARDVADLPVNGRNFINFTLLTPGVTTDVRDGDISFAGQRGTLNSLVVDGSDSNNTFFGQTLGRAGSGRAPYQFSQDAVQEFQVNSNDYSAELGHAGGAVINVITKSGTNQFHGTAFEFYRDRSMNANDPINIAKGKPTSPYHFNQFGGNLGGPIAKDKVFFFFDYDGQRNTVANFVFLNLPAGFTPSDANEQTALNYLTAQAGSWNQTFNQDVYLGKVDWRLGPGEMLSARYNAQRFTGANLENGGPQNALEHTGASNVASDTWTFSLTSTVTPTVVNVMRANFARDDEPGQANSDLPQAAVKLNGLTVLTVGRNFFSPRFTNIHRGEWGDTMTFVHGRSTWKTGANLLVDRIDNFFPGNFSGQYTFNSLESFGANLNGAPAPATGDTFVQAFAGSGTSGPTTNPNLSEFSVFGQDDWRVKPSFTLNLGLRYDLEGVAQPPTFNSDPQLAAAGIVTNRIHTDYTDFGPRLGFAWTPFSSSRLVVRGGYGIYYGRTPTITTSTAFANNGLNVQTLTFTGSAIPLYPNTECGAPVPSPSCAAPTGGTSRLPIVFGVQPGYQQPNVQQMSLGTEWGITRNMALSVTFLHVKGTHLTRTLDINLQGPETPTAIGIAGTTQTLTFNAITQPRPFSDFFRIEEFQSNANSNYNGLTIELNKRFSRHYQMLGSYTYGKVIDDDPDATSVVPFSFDDAKMVSDPLNIRADRAVGNDDQRHRFVLSGVWNLSYASNLVPAARAILGGWRLSGIFTAETGQPYSPLLGFDLNGDSNSLTDRTPGIGRNTFRLPSLVSLDPRITRNFRVTERTRLQIIGEAFNVFNRANITGVNETQFSVVTSRTANATAICAPAAVPCLNPQALFGSPTSTFINNGPGARILQLAAKFIF